MSLLKRNWQQAFPINSVVGIEESKDDLMLILGEAERAFGNFRAKVQSFIKCEGIDNDIEQLFLLTHNAIGNAIDDEDNTHSHVMAGIERISSIRPEKHITKVLVRFLQVCLRTAVVVKCDRNVSNSQKAQFTLLFGKIRSYLNPNPLLC